MNALVIGGNKGFGRSISLNLQNHGYNITTIGRSKESIKGSIHYSCDVSDIKKYENILKQIRSEEYEINILACITGFARATKIEDVMSNFAEHEEKNITYIQRAKSILRPVIPNSTKSKIITIGSQWSYKVNTEELYAYNTCKNYLMQYCRMIAKVSKPCINHYCVPTMDTHQYYEVKNSFRNVGREDIIANFTPNGLAKPQTIAKSLINTALNTDKSGNTFVIMPNGIVKNLE